MWKRTRPPARLALGLAAAAIAIPVASAQPLCDTSVFAIEADHRYQEEGFTAEAAEAALAALRGTIPEWVDRAIENGWDASLTRGDIGMAYINNLNQVQGYILRQSALAEQAARESGDATQAFCDFLATTPIID